MTAIFILSPGGYLLLAEIAAALALGAAIGAAHYLLLWRSVELLVSGGSAWRAAALHIARFLMTGAALYFVARFGALPLAAALLGIMSARIVIGRRIGDVA
ncbi:MAG: ATP synthase subunit I [Methylovirgula sp.]